MLISSAKRRFRPKILDFRVFCESNSSPSPLQFPLCSRLELMPPSYCLENIPLCSIFQIVARSLSTKHQYHLVPQLFDHLTLRREEASLAPPCSNLRSLGSKGIAGDRSICDIFGTFWRPRSHSAPP